MKHLSQSPLMHKDTPWMAAMDSHHDDSTGNTQDGQKHPTTAVLTPFVSTHSTALPRSTILHHHKTPLLLATPPQVTRALAHSHHIIAPLNHFAGLVSWTTDDRWESFLLLALFWFLTLYIDAALRFGGPIVFTIFLSAALYLRRYSPLSSTSWTSITSKAPPKHEQHDPTTPDDRPTDHHHKSIDEIVGTLHTFTTRCNILLDPLFYLTDFLSTQQTPTKATTKPALLALFVRLLLALPLWIAFALPPLRLITFRRVVLVIGTLILTWHSPPASITRMILWRSKTIRYLFAVLTGLNFAAPHSTALGDYHNIGASASALALAKSTSKHTNGVVRFTFAIYENQRRWLGLGWTSNLFAYERAPWTDENLNPVSELQHFELPVLKGHAAKWRWADGSKWQVQSGSSPAKPAAAGSSTNASTKDATKSSENAWIYYDNKWHDGARGQDSWSKYTRRRKWIRDAELVDIVDEDDPESTGANQQAEPTNPTAAQEDSVLPSAKHPVMVTGAQVFGSPSSTKDGAKSRKSWFGGTSTSSGTKDTDDRRSSSREPTAAAAAAEDTQQPAGSESQPASSSSKLKRENSTASSRRSGRSGRSAMSSSNREKKHVRSASGRSSLAGSLGDGGVSSSRNHARNDQDEYSAPTDADMKRDLAWGLNDEFSIALG